VEPSALPAGTRRMLQAAFDRGIAVEIRERPAAASLEQAASLLGIRPADIAKTLVVRLSGGRFVLVVIGGDTQIAWPKLRAVVGVNKMSLPPADVALAATGYERGTITPLGSEPEWPLLIDQGLRGRRVAMGAGAHGYSAFVDIEELARGLGATVADLVE
jgi:Cys-tRNA(Pro)/Cys-tRNA(Cys) deacylase